MLLVDGRFSGDVFLTFSTEDAAAAANVKLSGKRFQNRLLESAIVCVAFVQQMYVLLSIFFCCIFQTSRAAMYAAMGGSWMVPPDGGQKLAILLCNLPFQLNPTELLQFLKALQPDAEINLNGK